VNLALGSLGAVIVFAFRNHRAKARQAQVALGGHLDIPCTVRRTYGTNRPTQWIGGHFTTSVGEAPRWSANLDQADTVIVLDPRRYHRVPTPDRSREIVLADVVTLETEGMRIEITAAAADVAALNSLYSATLPPEPEPQ
jgi:hypothetical protein